MQIQKTGLSQNTRGAGEKQMQQSRETAHKEAPKRLKQTDIKRETAVVIRHSKRGFQRCQ